MMAAWTRRSRIEWLERALLERVVVLDGAMGTMIQQAGLGESDYRGVEFAESGRWTSKATTIYSA